MELKQVLFEKRTRISATGQKLPLLIFVFMLGALAGALIYLSIIQFAWVFIALALACLCFTWLSFRAFTLLRKVEADDTNVFVSQKDDKSLVLPYACFYAASKPLLKVSGMNVIKLYYKDEKGQKKIIRFVPRLLGNHYNNFVDALFKVNPGLKIKTSIF